MSPPVGRSQGSVGALAADREKPPERKTAGLRAGKQPAGKQPVVKDQRPKKASPPTSGVVGLSCPAVTTLPNAPSLTPNSPANVIFSGTNAQDQNGVCSAQPPQFAGQAIPASAAAATAAAPSLSFTDSSALIANWHDVDDAVKVLEGLTGPGQQQEAAYVVNQALLRFGDVGHVKNLIDAVRDNSGLHKLVVEQILHRAAELEAKSTPENRDTLDGPHHQARIYVLATIKAMQGRDAEPGHEAELGTLIAQKLSPEEGEFLAKILGVENPLDNSTALLEARHRLLSALNNAHTKTTSAVVQTLYLLMDADDILKYPPLAESLAAALAHEFCSNLSGKPGFEAAIESAKNRLLPILQSREGDLLMLRGSEERRERILATLQSYNITVETFAHHKGPWVTEPTFAHLLAEGMIPAEAPNRDALVRQMGDILATQQGQQIRFGWYGFDARVDLATKLEAIQVILDNHITAKQLQETLNPWENPILVKAIAAKRMAGLIEAKLPIDVPIKFESREYLVDFVAITSGLPPDHPKVKLIVDQLIRQGGPEPVVSFRPVFFSSETTGIGQFPLYRADTVANLGPNRFGQNVFLRDHLYVDDMGRASKTSPNQGRVPRLLAQGETPEAAPADSALEEWLGTSQMPSGVVVFPRNGHLSRDEKTGTLALDMVDTPEKGRNFERGITATMLVGGIFAGGLTLAGAGGGLASWIGAGSTLHGIFSAIVEREDRADQGLSNAWSDPAGRAVNLSLGASIASCFMFGVGPILKEAIYAGRLSHEMALLAGLANTIGAGTDAAAFVNGVVDLIGNYKRMEPDQIGLAIVQLGLQGLMSGVGIHQAGGLGRAFNPMAQARALIAEYLPPPTVHLGHSSVKGNEVATRLVDGHHYEVFVGKDAVNDKERIAIHERIAREAEGDIRLTEMLARWVGARWGTEKGSIVLDIRKLDIWIAQQKIKLQFSADLTPEERAAIVNDIAACEKHRDELTRRLQELRDNPRADRGGQAILLPDSTGTGGARPASASEQFIEWLGKEHGDILTKAKAELEAHGINVDQTAHGGFDPYRNPPTNPVASNADTAVDNIVAWIVQSDKGRLAEKGWWGGKKYRDIYLKYVELIDARTKKLDQLRGDDADAVLRSGVPIINHGVAHPLMDEVSPTESDVRGWLYANHRQMMDRANLDWIKNPRNWEGRSFMKVTDIIWWLIRSNKYRLGVDPKYNDIFVYFIKLNAARLREIHDRESSLLSN